MSDKRAKFLVIVGLALLAFMVNAAFAQPPAKGPGAASQPPQGHKVTLKGTILHSKDFGGYVLITQAPHEEYKIMNENAKVLKPLAKQEKPVTVEGRLVHGAYLLFIEKLDGKEYQGAKGGK